jgi:hypothetical protein
LAFSLKLRRKVVKSELISNGGNDERNWDWGLMLGLDVGFLITKCALVMPW